MMKSSRLAAFETLYKIFYDAAYSNLALDAALQSIDSKGKAFTTGLVYGVTERRLTLDYLLSPYLDGRTKPKVKVLLYLGAYQLYFMDKVPSAAAINETVKLADEIGCAYYKRLINAVLHKVDANRIDIDAIEDLSVRYSCPPHLIRMWQKMYGEAAAKQILSASVGQPPVFAVPNPLYVDADELQYELLEEGIACEVCGPLVKLASAAGLTATKAFERGLFHVEDKSAYECAAVLAVQPGETVLDVCAAPGGKTFTAAALIHNSGTVYACDLYPQRVGLIEQGAVRLGLQNIKTIAQDATVFHDGLPPMDAVLCDVPCSGFGIIRRKPEIKYKDLDSIKSLPETQLQILSVSAAYLKTNGRLVYATCTLNQRENEKVVSRFLAAHPQFRLLSEKTTFPSAEGGDGFYYALLTKTDD
ncbi:MAG: 16S rRNA (cytosine(967)-C(5))-methyltransferase RsmB [Eubacterium sp.]|nr:16S rRNA (cytosine(967)-C(5))-methyltransferase RsmB [Eubacterium sp.]